MHWAFELLLQRSNSKPRGNFEPKPSQFYFVITSHTADRERKRKFRAISEGKTSSLPYSINFSSILGKCLHLSFLNYLVFIDSIHRKSRVYTFFYVRFMVHYHTQNILLFINWGCRSVMWLLNTNFEGKLCLKIPLETLTWCMHTKYSMNCPNE